MTDFYKRHKKLMITVAFLFLLFFGGFWSVKYNLPKTVEVLTGIFLGPKFKSSNIVFEKNRIVVKDFVLQDKDEVIIKSPQVDILYGDDWLKTKRIQEIIVNGGEANITRRKNGDINVVAAFTGSSDSEEEEPETEYVPGIAVPIDRITGKDITTTYRDYSYRLPIEKTAYDTNGFMTFSETKGLDLHFIGYNGEEVFDYSFNNYKEPYSMTIKLSNIGVTTELVQYGYDGDELSYNGGKLNMDLTIASSGLAGWLDFNSVDVKYKDLNDTIKNVYGRADFKPDGIFITSYGDVFGKKEKVTLSYKDEELNVDFNIKDIAQKDAEKLSYLEGIELPFKNAVIDDVKFNLNLKKEVKITVDILVKKLSMENLDLDGTSLQFIYDNEGLHIKDLNSEAVVVDTDKEEKIREKIKLSMDYNNDVGNVKFQIKNINDKRYIPDIDGILDFSTKKDAIVFNFRSDILNLKGNYFSKEEKLVLKDEKYFLEYDVKNKKYIKGKGEFSITLLNNRFLIAYSGDNNFLKIDRFSIFNELGITEKFLSGEINLETMEYEFDLSGEKFIIENFMSEEKNPIVEGKIEGKIVGHREKVISNLDVDGLSGDYIAKIKNINGKLALINDEKLNFDFSGEIGNIEYNDYSVDGLLAVFRFKDDKFEVKSLKNSFIDISGIMDTEIEKLDFKGEVKNLPLKKFNVDSPVILINDMSARFYGNLKNPHGDVNIKDISVEINDGQPIIISGNIDFTNNKFYTDNLKINNSIVKGEYLLKNNSYRARMNIIEEDIGRYYGDTNLKYRVIGTLNIKGQDKKIDADFKSTFDKMYIQGNHLPNIYLETSYKSNELLDGVLKIDEVLLSNTDLQNIVKFTGKFDLTTKKLNLDLPKQEIPLGKLKEYLPLKEVEGSIFISGDVAGPVDDIRYTFNTTSEEIKIQKVDFNKIKIAVTGDLNEAKLNEFSFRYLENLFYSNGSYNIKNGKYKYNANSKKINLGFLNVFLNKYKIENVNGEGIFDLQLTNDKNSGYLTINNFALEKKDLFLKLKDFNSTIRLAGNKLYTDSLVGKLNDGDMFFKGNITVPSLNEIVDNPYFYENLKYEANLELKNVKYKYGKFFNLDFNTDLSFKNKNLFGQFEILKGEVFEIPTKSESIFEKIRKFLFSSASKTINDSESLGQDFKIDTIFENSINVNIGIKIVDGIKLDIETLVAMVTDVKGIVTGSGVISGNNGKYLFLGNIETVGARLNVNDNTFVIDRGLLAFNDKKTYFPKINPSILIDASVEVKNDRIGLGLNGNLDNLQFNISSKSGNSSGSLNSLLTGDGDRQENNDATATLLTSVIGGQFTQILKPVSNLVKNVLGLSKFRIASNFLTEDTTSKNYNSERQSRVRVGAVLEAEDNIYKDKIWWVAKATLLEEDSDQVNNGDENGAFKDYDFSLEYRFDYTKSIGIGVGKLPKDMRKTSNGDSKKNLNYHIDFKFEKKYDNLLDIFINK